MKLWTAGALGLAAGAALGVGVYLAVDAGVFDDVDQYVPAGRDDAGDDVKVEE